MEKIGKFVEDIDRARVFSLLYKLIKSCKNSQDLIEGFHKSEAAR